MAIILGRKEVIDLKEKDRVAVGVTLPLQRGNTGYFQQSFQTIEQVKSNIKNLILTRPGERFMHPTFGTGLWSLLFNQNTEIFEADVEDAIQTAVEKWMPFIEIDKIEIQNTDSDKDQNQFQINISFRLSNQTTLNTVTFNITE